MKFMSIKSGHGGENPCPLAVLQLFLVVCAGSGDGDLFRGRMAILILHCTGKNAILGKLKLTVAYFHQIQEIAKEDGTQTAGILYHCM